MATNRQLTKEELQHQLLLQNLKDCLAYSHREIPWGQQIKIAHEGLNRAAKQEQTRQSKMNLLYSIIQSLPNKKQKEELNEALADSLFPGLGVKELGKGKDNGGE